MLHVSHTTWKLLILGGSALVLLMLAEVAAARTALDRGALQQPTPIEEAIDPTWDLRPPAAPGTESVR